MEQNNLERIEHYIFKKMSEEETNLFEQEMNANPSLKKEMELHKAIILGIRKKSKNKTLEKIKSFKATLDEEEEIALIDDYIFGKLPLEKSNEVDKRVAADDNFGQKVKLQKAIILGLKKKRKEKTLAKIELFKKKLDEKKVQTSIDEGLPSPTERRESVIVERESIGTSVSDTTGTSKPSGGLFTRLKRPLAIAASVAILVVAAIFLRDSKDFSKDLFPEYVINEQISNTNAEELTDMLGRINGAAFNGRDTDEAINELTKQVIEAYNNDDFNKAIELANNQTDNRIKYIKALSLWKNENYSESELTFENLLTSMGDNNSFIRVSSNWYLALIALKENRIDAAKILLNKVVNQSSDFGEDLESYQNNAKQILNELESKIFEF